MTRSTPAPRPALPRLVTIGILVLVTASPLGARDESDAEPGPLLLQANRILRDFRRGNVHEKRVRRLLANYVAAAEEGDPDGSDAAIKVLLALARENAAKPELEERVRADFEQALSLTRGRSAESAEHQYATCLYHAYLMQRGESGLPVADLERAMSSYPRRTIFSQTLALHAAQREALVDRHGSALRFLDAAERPLDEDHPGYPTKLVEAAFLRIQIFLGLGIGDKASYWLEQADRILGSIESPDPRLLAQREVYLANIHLAAERWTRLEAHVRDALARDHWNESTEGDRVKLLNRQAVATAVLEILDPARERTAEALFRQVLEDPTLDRQPVERRTALTRLAHLKLDRGRLDEAEDLLRSLADERSPGDGLEDPLGRLHLAALETRLQRLRGTSPGSSELETALDAVLTNRREREIREGGTGTLGHARTRIGLSETILLTLEREGEVGGPGAALEILLEAQSTASLARVLESPPATLPSLREELLAPGRGFLFYLPTRDRSHVFAVDGDGVLHRELPTRYRLTGPRREFANRVTSYPPLESAEAMEERRSHLHRTGSELFDLLFPEAIRERVLSWDEVTIVGDLLGYLPFEALPTGEDEVLDDRITIGYTPSISVALALARRFAERERAGRYGEDSPLPLDLVLLADPERSSELSPRFATLPDLVLDADERATLTAAVPPERLRVLTGPDASWKGLHDTLPDTRTAQILVHGIQDPRKERSAGLLLSPSPLADGSTDRGEVWLDRMDGITASDLVLLTACRSGEGPYRWGDSGVNTFAGTLLRTGSLACVLPRAELEESSTIRLAGAFLPRVLAGEPIAASMRHARRTLRQDPRYRDPFFWALLHARGLPHARLYPSREKAATPLTPWVIGMATVLIAVGLYAASRRSR